MLKRYGGDKVADVAKNLWKIYEKNAGVQDAAETIGSAAVIAGGQALFTDMTPEEIAVATLLGGGLAFAARPVAANLGGAIGRQLDKRSIPIGEKVMTMKPSVTVPPMPHYASKPSLNNPKSWIPQLTESKKIGVPGSLRDLKESVGDNQFQETLNFLAALYPGTPQSRRQSASLVNRGESYYKMGGLDPFQYGTSGEGMFAGMSLFGKPLDKGYWQTANSLNRAKYQQNFRGRTPLEGLLTSTGRVYGDNIAQASVALSAPLLIAALKGEEAVTPV